MTYITKKTKLSPILVWCPWDQEVEMEMMWTRPSGPENDREKVINNDDNTNTNTNNNSYNANDSDNDNTTVTKAWLLSMTMLIMLIQG